MGYMKYCSHSTQIGRVWALFQPISKAQRGRNSLLGILSFLVITIMAVLEPSQQATQASLIALTRNKMCTIYLSLGGSLQSWVAEPQVGQYQYCCPFYWGSSQSWQPKLWMNAETYPCPFHGAKLKEYFKKNKESELSKLRESISQIWLKSLKCFDLPLDGCSVCLIFSISDSAYYLNF